MGIYPCMNLRRLVLLVGAVVLIVGVIGLLMPVSVAGPDGQNDRLRQRDRGRYLRAPAKLNNSNPVNLPIINELIPHTDYAAQCQSAVSQRRTWSIPVAIIGLVLRRRLVRRRRPDRAACERLAGFASGNHLQARRRFGGRDLVVDICDHRVDPVHRPVTQPPHLVARDVDVVGGARR